MSPAGHPSVGHVRPGVRRRHIRGVRRDARRGRRLTRAEPYGGWWIVTGHEEVFAAARDPKLYDCPGGFRLARAEKSHVAFDLGAHRCIGSNIARLEFRSALEEWLRRILEYDLAEGHVFRRKIDHSHGPVALPLTFPPGARRCSDGRPGQAKPGTALCCEMLRYRGYSMSSRS